jgi:hypothetical protein
MQETTTMQRDAQFWVVGGEYADTAFERLQDGETPAVYGPFASYQDAREVWQQKTLETRPLALVRYSIAVSGAGAG